MQSRSVGFGQEKSTMLGRRSYDKKASNLGVVLGEKHNRCMMVPAKTNMIAEAIERKANNWYIAAFMFHSLSVCFVCVCWF